MSWFKITDITVYALTISLLAFSIAIYLFRIKKKDPATLYLALFNTGIGMMFLCGLLYSACVDEFREIFMGFQTISAMALLVPLVQFAFHFEVNDTPRAARILFIITGGGTLLSVVISIISIFENRPLSGAAVSLNGMFAMLEYLAAMAILLRKTNIFSRLEEGQTSSTKTAKKRGPFASLGYIVKPVGRSAAAARNFALLVLFSITFTISVVLTFTGTISRSTHGLVMGNGFLFFVFMLALVYLNHSRYPISFMVKLVGVTLVTILVVLGFLNYWFFENVKESYFSRQQLVMEKSRNLVLEQKRDFPPSLVYVSSAPAGREQDPRAFTIDYTRPGEDPLDAPGIQELTLYVSKDKNQLLTGQVPEMTRLERIGPNKYTYLPEYFIYRFSIPGRIYELGFDVKHYRGSLHPVGKMFFFIILLTYLFIVTIIPYFFRHNVTAPLNNLLEGVGLVNSGNFSVEIPIRMQDEFGVISSSFNKMVKSIQVSNRKLEEYSRTLEQKVAERTRELREKNHKILSSIEYAQLIQQAILPEPGMLRETLPEYFILYLPKDIVSGDFYWVYPTKEGVLVALVDCTGHGVPGAIMSMIGTMLLNQIVQQRQVIASPARIMEELHKGIRRDLKQEGSGPKRSDEGMDMAICMLERQKSRVTFAGAKQHLYLVRGNAAGEDGESRLSIYKGNRKTVGGRQKEKARTFTETAIPLQPGDMIYLSTDGFQHQHDKDEKKIGRTGFTGLLNSIAHLEMERQHREVKRFLANHMGREEQRDDISIVGIRW